MNIIDIHTHGIAGFDTRTSNPEDILRMAEIQASCGVSAIVPTIYPDSIEVMRQNIMAVKMAMEMQKAEGGANSACLQDRLNCAKILGVHLEGPFLNSSKCGALESSFFIEPSESNLRKLIDEFEDIVKIITIAPELNGAVNLIKKISEMGIAASMGHSDATYAEAEAGFNAGARGITHIFNAMRGIHHREPGIAGFGLLNNDIYIEVIADTHHLNEKTMDLIFRTKNPERIIVISDSVKQTKISDREYPHAVMSDSGRLQGGSLCVKDALDHLRRTGFRESIIKRCVAENPDKYLSSPFVKF